MAKKKKTTLNRKRVMTEPAFQRSRESMLEFGRAGKANRLLRQAHALVLVHVGDRYISGRLTKVMMNIVQTDPVNERGSRIVSQGELSILEGFNFNRHTSLHNVLHTSWTIIPDPDNNQVIIDIPLLIPRAMIETSSGADYFKITGIAAATDFEQELFPVEPVSTDFLDAHANTRQAIQLALMLPPGNTLPVVVSLGILFYRFVNGEYSRVDKTYNAMTVVKVIKG